MFLIFRIVTKNRYFSSRFLCSCSFPIPNIKCIAKRHLSELSNPTKKILNITRNMPPKKASTNTKASSNKKELTTTDVFLYYPNLIGYLRVGFMIASFVYAAEWKVSVACYLLAFMGDVLDGHVARAFNQCKI